MIFHFKEIRNMFLGFILIREQGISLTNINGNFNAKFKETTEFITRKEGRKSRSFKGLGWEFVSP